jgi:hypothetical protein
MIHSSVAARVTCDCSSDGRTDVCGASVVGYDWTEGMARQAAVCEAWVAGWVLVDAAPGRSARHYAPGHVVLSFDGSWVRPVSLVKAYV